MFATTLICLVLGQLPGPGPVELTQTCWRYVPSSASRFSFDFGGFASQGGLSSSQSWSFGAEEFEAAPAFGSRFRFEAGFDAPILFDASPRFVAWPAPLPVWAAPRIKFKNKVKIRGRLW